MLRIGRTDSDEPAKKRGLQTSCILRCASYGQLADDRGIRPKELTLESSYSDREISLVGLADKNGKTIGAMLWFSDQIPTDQLERELVSLTIDGLSLKEAVYVENRLRDAYMTCPALFCEVECPEGKFVFLDFHCGTARFSSWKNPAFLSSPERNSPLI